MGHPSPILYAGIGLSSTTSTNHHHPWPPLTTGDSSLVNLPWPLRNHSRRRRKDYAILNRIAFMDRIAVTKTITMTVPGRLLVSSRRKKIPMVAWLLIGVLCITDAIRPSATTAPGVGGSKAFTSTRRPLRRLWYRRLDEGAEDVTKSRRIPALEHLRALDRTTTTSQGTTFLEDNLPSNLETLPETSTISREALAAELSTLLEGIETLTEDLEATRSFPPLFPEYTSAPPTKKSSSEETTKQQGDNTNNNNIRTVHELRRAILDEAKELKDIQLDAQAQLVINATTRELLHHDVVELMVKRFQSGSTPGNRAPDDKARLALAIEGGGMRGAVSAGMASAIACLGLCDTFDTVYGSSAGSVIGGYMISRQMCMDVYVDILPAAKRTFVCTKRIVSSLAMHAIDIFLSGVRRRARLTKGSSNTTDTSDAPPKSGFAARASPGMNISFVLDGIMDPDHGLRPMDMEAFRRNDKKQPLRVASSYVKDGKLHCKCFGSEHFFGEHAAVREDGKRRGLFACLEPSMTVPGATGPPVRLKTHDTEEILPYFDAFCFEPLPYRSAVDDGATHVLVLCSRPEGFQPKTKPGVYEQGVAPLYFKSHGEPKVAEFFARGGQQYIYLEDMMTLAQGKLAGMNKEGPISVPPAKLLYGVEEDHHNHAIAAQRDEKWNKAHLLPLKVPLGTPELATLEQGQDAVREAVKGGFAAAFDLLAPAIGLNTHEQLTGAEVAALIFPKKAGMLDEIILREKLRVDGESIRHPPLEHVTTSDEKPKDQSPSGRRRRHRVHRDRFLRNARHVLRVLARNKQRQAFEEEVVTETDEYVVPNLTLHGGDVQPPAVLDSDKKKAEHLLNSLPGLRSGKMPQLAANLHHVASSTEPATATTFASTDLRP